MSDVLRGCRRGLAAVGAAVLVTALTACRTGPAEPQPGLTFGVLGGSCDADRVGALQQAGVRFVEVGVRWSRFEPAPEQFDQAYIDALRARLARCTDAGLGVVLTPGFQYAPAWVRDLPDGRYRDQNGAANPAKVPNYVFSATVRGAAERYLDRFAAEFPLDGFAAVRIGTSEAGELGYPGMQLGTEGNRFWAFDDAALSGDGLPVGMPPNPMPGWKPGERTWQGRPIDAAAVRSWFDWYAGSAVRTTVWQIGVLRDRGYRGPIHMPLAGRGVLPADLAAATAAALDGTADRDGSLERGLFYPEQLRAIAGATDASTLFADVTGVDDATAVAARELDPPQDTCQAADASLPLRDATSVDTWSATRWTVANARAAGLRVIGENPGHPATPGTGGDDSSDDLVEQLVHAPRYAQECGFAVLMWAFEDDLFGSDPEVSVDDLARRIAFPRERRVHDCPAARAAPRLRGPGHAWCRRRLAAHPRDQPPTRRRRHGRHRVHHPLPRLRGPRAGRRRSTSTSGRARAARGCPGCSATYSACPRPSAGTRRGTSPTSSSRTSSRRSPAWPPRCGPAARRSGWCSGCRRRRRASSTTCRCTCCSPSACAATAGSSRSPPTRRSSSVPSTRRCRSR